MAEIDFLCVRKEQRLKGLAMLLIKEITRRLELEGSYEDAIYTSEKSAETSFTNASCHVRFLNPSKLVQTGYTTLGWNEDMSHFARRHSLPKQVSSFSIFWTAIFTLLHIYIYIVIVWLQFKINGIERCISSYVKAGYVS